MTQLQSPVQTPQVCRKRVRSGTPPGTPPEIEVDEITVVEDVSEDNEDDEDDDNGRCIGMEFTTDEMTLSTPPSGADEPPSEVEPMWKKNASFLLSYLLRRDDQRTATHASLVGGRYFIPPEMRPEFYRQYYQEFVTLAPPSLFLTERYNDEPFRFFIDMDFDFHDENIPKHVDVIAQIRGELAARWEQYVKIGVNIPTIELFPCRAARRTNWKLHLIFHKLVVDWRSALKLGQWVQKKLEDAGCGYKLDPMVYTKGSLRMVGSFKKNEVTPSHERENEFTYTPIDIVSGEELEVTEATIEEFSIFLPEVQRRCVDEAQDLMAQDGSLDFRSGEGGGAAGDDTAAYKGIGSVAPESPIFKCIQTHYGLNMAVDADKIIQFGTSLMITMKSTFCPLFGREHGSNHAYITLSRKGMRVKCHSPKREQCRGGGDVIPSKDLPAEVTEMIPVETFYTNPAQNAAFIRSFSGTDRDVAEYAQFALRDAFVAVNTKNNESTWWHYKNGRWNNAAAGTLLYGALDRLPLVYEEVAANTEDEKARKQLENIAIKCSDLTFLNKLISRMCRILHDTTFENKLDSKRHLLGFDNGVYDFEEMRFRPSVKEDYLTMSVGYDFPTESDPNYRAKLDKFYADVQPDPVQRLYLKKVLAGSLNTSNPKEEFYVLSGTTRNGKTGLGDLHSCTLGSKEFADENDNKHKYASSYNATFLTKERKGPEVPAPDLVDFRLCRFLIGNEPPPDSKINTSTLKKTVGRDTFSGRLLHENKMWHFKIFALIFMNCNDRPAMSSNEPAVWGKVRVIDFPNKFVPNPTLPHELLEDPKLKTEMVTDVGWRREHMKMLIEIYENELIPNGLVPPESVLAATREYCEESNPLLQWWDEKTEEATTHVSTVELRESFRFSENGDKDISAKAFTKRLRLELGVNVNSSVRCVGKENPTVGVENRRIKDYDPPAPVV